MFDAIIQTASETWNVPIAWIKAVIDVESSWNPNAFNPGDPSYGLMAILDRTAKSYGITNMQELFDPATNIDIGTHLLSDLRIRYGDDFRAVYSAYNSGSATLWQTSTEVADHVSRALAALQGYLSEIPGGIGVILILFVLYRFIKR